MKKLIFCSMLFISVVLLSLETAFSLSSAISEGLSARAIGMGSAFMAIADDSTAAWYNPAGLMQLVRGNGEISIVNNTFPTANLDKTLNRTESKNHEFSFFSYANTKEKNTTWALGYYQIGKSTTNDNSGIKPDISESLDIDTGFLSYASKLPAHSGNEYLYGISLLRLGIKDIFAAANRASGTVDVNATKMGINVGIIGKNFENKFNWALVYRTGAKSSGGVGIPSKYGIGFSKTFGKSGNFTASSDMTVSLYSGLSSNANDTTDLKCGFEYLLISGKSIIPLRLGYRTEKNPFKQIVGSENQNFATAGFGYATSLWNIDMAFESGNRKTNNVSISTSFRF